MSEPDVVIRPIGRDEVMTWRALRLEAMRAYPTAFSASPDDWEKLPIEEVAWRCGLGTAANLRLHLARDAAITPTAYRNAFRADTAPVQAAR